MSTGAVGTGCTAAACVCRDTRTLEKVLTYPSGLWHSKFMKPNEGHYKANITVFAQTKINFPCYSTIISICEL